MSDITGRTAALSIHDNFAYSMLMNCKDPATDNKPSGIRKKRLTQGTSKPQDLATVKTEIKPNKLQ